MSLSESVLVVMATAREMERVRWTAPQVRGWTFAKLVVAGKLRGWGYTHIYVDHFVSEFLTEDAYRAFDQELSMSGATIWEALGSEPDFQFTSF